MAKTLRPPPQSLIFLHVPKTGTSFVRSLRLVLTTCLLKDFDCSVGKDYQNKMRKAHGVYNWTYLPAEVPVGEDDCRGHLWACQGDDAQNRLEYTAHSPFKTIWEKEPGAQVVTLLREPVEHLFSVVAWEHRRVPLNDFTAIAPRICTSMVWGFAIPIPEIQSS